jgi:hypothetical protein
MSLDERSFFSDRNETRPARYTCSRCRRTNEYTIRWVRRVKKDRLPPGADERDRAKFAKLRDHLIRVDDEVVCKSCGKKIEIPSLHSLLFVDQLEGLPRDVEEEEVPGAGAGAGAGAVPGADAGAGAVPGAGAGARAGAAVPGAGAVPHPADRQPQDRQPQDRARGPRRLNSPSRGWRG